MKALSAALYVLIVLGPEPEAVDDVFCHASTDELATLETGKILVELREVEGSAAKEGCAIGMIEAPASDVFEVIDDASRHAEFMPHVKESTVEDQEDGSYLCFQRLKLPFPIKNRHYQVQIWSTPPASDDDTWRIQWNYVEGTGNVEENYGSWMLRQLEPNKTIAVYRLYTNPGGMIPKWALNRASKKTLPKVVEAVRERVEELQEQAPLANEE